jgi:hypothetical protein
MQKKSLVFMMLLAASLIGIGSAINYQPEVTIAQPQPQSPNTAPPTLGKTTNRTTRTTAATKQHRDPGSNTAGQSIGR